MDVRVEKRRHGCCIRDEVAEKKYDDFHELKVSWCL